MKLFLPHRAALRRMLIQNSPGAALSAIGLENNARSEHESL
ncbi:hypothetical protein [Comamonas sp. SCN 65-56]|nr:hypothetical protein [Comamonas sp. SCN 65-56]